MKFAATQTMKLTMNWLHFYQYDWQERAIGLLVMMQDAAVSKGLIGVLHRVYILGRNKLHIGLNGGM